MNCVYCGCENPQTVDHIPPVALFPSPRPSNLITVPSCLNCNKNASKDDEYFKNMLVIRADISGRPTGKRLLGSVLRSFSKPRKRAMLQALINNMKDISVFTPGGLYLGNAAAYNVSIERIQNVINRIVKGLFFKERQERLIDSYGVKSIAQSSFNELNSSARDNISKMVSFLLTKKSQVIGEGVFEYRYEIMKEDPNASVWLLSFFESESFFCITAPQNKNASAT